MECATQTKRYETSGVESRAENVMQSRSQKAESPKNQFTKNAEYPLRVSSPYSPTYPRQIKLNFSDFGSGTNKGLTLY